MLTEGGAYAFKKMQTGATATGDGNSMTPLTVNGGSYALLTAQVVGISGDTITWEGTIDEEHWEALPALNVSTRAISTTATADGIYRLVVTSLVAVKARVSTYSAGTIWVYGLLTASGEPGFLAEESVVTDHALLDNLAYASSGHTGFEASGTAAAAISTHVGLSDPHTQYALESALGTMAAATETDYLLASGTRTGASSQAQTFTNGLVVGGDRIKTDRWLNSDTNTVLGMNALGAGNLAHSSGTQGWYNVAIGDTALRALTTGERNMAVGSRSLYSCTTGMNNVAIGFEALFSNSTGTNNLAIGTQTLGTSTIGAFNVAIGVPAMYVSTEASQCVAIGGNTLHALTTGSYHVAIGAGALQSVVTAYNNTAIGWRAGYGATGGSNVFIGYTAGYVETNSNRLHIANDETKSLLLGKFDTNCLAIGFTDLSTPTAAIDCAPSTTTRASFRARAGTAPTTPNDGDLWNDGNAYVVMVNGTNAVNTDGGLSVWMQSSTTARNVGRLLWQYTTKTDATRVSEGSLTAYYQSTERKAVRWSADSGGPTLGFYNGAPVAKAAAYTQTYSTADRTLSTYTADDESGAYTGIDNAQVGTVYAQLTDLNALRTAYENLRAFVEDLAQHHNSLLDDMQALNLVG